MLEALSPDTQATLLLVGRFANSPDSKPLTTAEYNQLAKQLYGLEMRPADIVRGVPKGLIVDSERVSRLLRRGTSLALAVERWSRAGIKVLGRSDSDYPSLFKTKLRGAAAPIIYLAGKSSLLASDAVCIVGSRNVSPSGLRFAACLGERCASEGLAVVSGDARGVDRAAMDAALGVGGSVVAVLVESLTKAVLAKRNRDPILAGKLALLSPYDPDCTFTVASAMDRNKYMYALATAAVVVESDTKGGTWSGAVENAKHRWTPAFVRLTDDSPVGNRHLADRGLLPMPKLSELETIKLREFLFSAEGTAGRDLLPAHSPGPSESGSSTVGSLYGVFIEGLIEWLSDGPQPETAIAHRFALERAQVRAWLDRAQHAGVVDKLHRPIRFALRPRTLGVGHSAAATSQVAAELPL